MIPTVKQAQRLWDTYHLPPKKRIHVTLVARVAVFLAEKIGGVNIPLLEASALLHDIDKAIERLPGERHPDTAVRVLSQEGMDEVARVVSVHSLHSIIDQKNYPKTIEEKILYLSDKMVKYEIITVDKRFALWREEDLPKEAVTILDQAYPLVKQLEHQLFHAIAIAPEDVAKILDR